MRWYGFLLCLLLGVVLEVGGVVKLAGAGSSFASEVYSLWMPTYRQYRSKHVDLNMTYEIVESGKGKDRIKGESLPMLSYVGTESLLTDDERQRFPDLEMIPVMAGAIVLGFNIPGVTHLNLSLDQLVGVYNGTFTYWDQLQDVNPYISLPHERIRVVARKDKSGTTESFTRVLSVHSPAWQETYGTFSTGLDSSGNPINWSPRVVEYFGISNRAMSGIILSVIYSIGYVSIADARKTKLKYSMVQNEAGNAVYPSLESIQDSIKNADRRFDLTNRHGEQSYPLTVYTFFVIRMSMADCSTATELVRYIKWFYESEIARKDCEVLSFYPIEKLTYSSVIDNVLKKVTCSDGNVFSIMEAQISTENFKDDSFWKIPLFVVIGLFFGLLITVAVYFTFRQKKMYEKILQRSWLVPYSEIKFNSERTQCIQMLDKSQPEYVNTMARAFNLSKNTALRDALFREEVVTIFPISETCCEPMLTYKTKSTLIKFRESISHSNIMKFIGLTEYGPKFSAVYGNIFRGLLTDVLNNLKIQISDNGKVSAAMEIVSGMKYLHKKNIVHGSLKGSCCLVDLNWTVKIARWEDKSICLCSKHIYKARLSKAEADDDVTETLIWVSPELLEFNRRPSFSSDVYSFGLVLQEIFSGKEPYKDLLDTMTKKQLLGSILKSYTRPKVSTKTPLIVQSLMEKAWQKEPSARPTFQRLHQMFEDAFPESHSLMDCMIEAIEKYTTELEKKLTSARENTMKLRSAVETCLRENLPLNLAREYLDGVKHEAECFASVSVLICQIDNMMEFVQSSDLKTVVEMHEHFSKLMSPEKVYKVNIFGDTMILTSGLPKRTTKHAEYICSLALSMMNSANEMFESNKLQTTGPTKLRIRIGIGTGRAIAAVTGASTPKYSVVGEAVSMAWKLVRSSLPNRILISQATNLFLPEDFETIRKVEMGKKSSAFWLVSKHVMEGRCSPTEEEHLD